MSRIKLFLGWALSLLGLLMVGIWVDELVKGENKSPVAMAVMIGLFALGGVQLIRSGRRDAEVARLSDPQAREQTPEHVVLRVARDAGGTVTVAQVAAASVLSFDEAQVELDKLVRKGACELDSTDEGVVIYKFAGLMVRA